MRQLLPLLLACLITPSLPGQKQDAKALELLDHARSLSSSSATGIPAYRIEAAFETFDTKGVSDGIGTAMQTALPDGHVKRVTTYRGKTSEKVRSGEWHGVADEDYLETFLERHLLDALFDPVPSAEQLAAQTVTLRPWKSGAVKLQCAVVSIALPNEKDSHAMAPSNAYCVDEGAGMLRMISGHNGYNVVMNGFRRLGGMYVPGDVVVTEGGVKRGHLSLTRFEAAPELTVANFEAPILTSGKVDTRRSTVDHDALQGKIVKKPTPRFPEEAKQRHISGTVTLNAIIGRDGSVRDLEVLTAPDDSLAVSAIEAVNQWRYKPFLKDDKPVEVEAIITVHYYLSR